MSNRPANNSWLICHKPNPDARLRLFCFPYAGAGAMIYRPWADILSPLVEVYSVNLPGRGTRMSEPPLTRLAEVVHRIADEIQFYLTKPFSFFGHSMGAITSFELTHYLRSMNAPLPCHLFISGRSAPQLRETYPNTYKLPDREFIEELRRLNGTPHQLLENPELMQLMLPALRADFSVCQTYEHTPKQPLTCPLTAFGGLQDTHISREQIEGWREQTTGAFVARMLPGDHFFLHSSQNILLRLIAQELYQLKG
ncbi:MAG TPA: thioesterase II family protein [Pyrinomonadaceae bacterium]